jgi:hypothetical protein
VTFKLSTSGFFTVISSFGSHELFGLALLQSEGVYKNHLDHMLAITKYSDNRKERYNIRVQKIDNPVISRDESLSKYENIIIMDANNFEQDCANIKKISDIVDFSVAEGKFSYQATEKEILYSNDIPASPALQFLKSPEDKNYVFSGKYNLSYFIKLTKCSQFSRIVKLYLGINNPLVIEYDIDNRIGVLQIIVGQHTVLKN